MKKKISQLKSIQQGILNKSNTNNKIIQFNNQLKKIFKSCRVYDKFQETTNNVSYNFQRMLYVSILEYEIKQFWNNQNSVQLQQYFQKLRVKTVQIQKIQKNCKVVYSSTQVTQIIDKLEKQILQQSLIHQINQIITQQIDYVMILLIRKIYIDIQGFFFNLFTGIDSILNNITQKQQIVKDIARYFGVKIIYYKVKEQFNRIPKFEANQIYVGSVKRICYSFYCQDQITKNPNQNQTKNNSKIFQKNNFENSQQVESVVSLPINHNNKSKIESDIQSNSVVSQIYDKKKLKSNINLQQSQLKSTHSLMSQSRMSKSSIITQMIQICAICKTYSKKTFCLAYNCKYICQTCILDPQTQIQSIPIHIIKKFIDQREIFPFELPIICPNCTKNTSIQKYDPINKPRIHICKFCKIPICLKHNSISYLCFCVCKKCNQETYINDKLQLKLCLKCKKTYCMNCKDNKCDCRCIYCFELNSLKNCKCFKQSECHYCQNPSLRMIKCECQANICRPCGFKRIRNIKGTLIFKCDNIQ